MEKSRVALDRSKKDFEGLQDSYDQLKSDLDKARKTYHEQREKFELEQTEFKVGILILNNMDQVWARFGPDLVGFGSDLFYLKISFPNPSKHQLKIKESHLKSANDEILVLRDQSGGATKALSKEKKRLEEVEDNLQRSLTAGRQRETALKSTIEGKEEEIAKLER